MRKETVYKIYEMLQEQYVVNNLRDFVILSNESGEILYEFIKLCMDVMDEDNLRVLTNLSFSMDELKDLEYKKQTLKNINELLSNDYVRNDPNFYKILSGINFLLNYDYNQSYEIEYEEDLYFYISFTVDSLIEIIQNTLNENIDIDQLYMHDMSFLMDNYVNTVINLYQSTSNDNDLSFNDIRLKKITYFKEILSNKDIVSLSKKKYNSVVKFASATTDIDRLKKMERIALFNKLKSDNEFNQILNDYCDDFTINTVEIINSKLGLKREYDEKRKDYIYTRKINNVEKEQEIVKKLLKPNKKY